MRLYLSSETFGDHSQELVRMTEPGCTALIVTNANDGVSAEKRREKLQRQIAGLNDLGFAAEELDLRDYFKDQTGLVDRINGAGLVWVKGGNTFTLKRAAEQSGFIPLITEAVKDNRLVYGGYSAGIILATPTLKGIELCDAPDLVPEGYDADFSWDCLNFVPYSIIPHFRSDNAESPMMEDVLLYMQKHDMPYRTMHDGDVLIVENDTERYLEKIGA